MGCEQSAPIQNDEEDNQRCCSANRPKAEFTYRRGSCALEYWEPLGLLGEGSISSIHLVRRRPERVDVPYKEKQDIMRLAAKYDNKPASHEEEVYALKSIMKDHVRNDKFLEEVRAEIYTMSRLCHENIVNVYEAFERKRHIYLIMEYCRGGDLNERKCTEAEAAVIIRQILLAVEYMHKHNVVHRDLKLENIMFDKDPQENPSTKVKVIDFGLATKFLSNEYKSMTDRVGTLYSMAPQVLQGVYDAKCDIWSIGVIAYILISGNKPFWGPPKDMSWEKRRKIIIDRIMRCEYMKMKGPSWANVSLEAKRFIESTLHLHPKLRPSAEKALQDPWIVKYQNHKPRMPPQNQQYAKKQQIKRKVQVLIAQDLLEDEIVQLKTALGKHDPSNKDRVSLEHLRTALLEQDKLKPDQVGSVFVDADLKDHVSYIALLNDALDRKEREQEELILDVFQFCGTDDNNCCQMSKEKVRQALQKRDGVTKETLGTILDSVAQAGNENAVSYEQLVALLKVLQMHRVDIICNCRDEGEIEEPDEDTRDLADETNSIIPGGKRQSSSQPVFVYDDESKSIRKCRPGEDLASSAISC